jgi:alpha-mannosidase
MHGQRYFESRFGLRCTEVWIPDVFGYPATLPQIFVEGGCERFVTQKLSWNKQNRMPHHTFHWFGLDGTSVLSHFPPVDTYGAEILPRELAHAQRNFADSGWSSVSLLPFGYGDGGGGPTREMLERLRRVADLDGLPRVELGTPDTFFEAVEAEVEAAGDRVPEWHGELYFEMHRGTLTTQSDTKVGNRTCEHLLREAELWWSLATHFTGDTSSYPSEALDAIWKEVLFQQFHDIIPGSSIAWVYEDTAETYGRLVPQLEELVGDALARLAGGAPAVANAATHARDEVFAFAELPVGDADAALDADAVQRLADGRVACRVAVPGMSVVPFATAAVEDRVDVDEAARTMRNGALEVRWDTSGALASVLDRRAGRELFLDGTRGATIELAPDHPVEYDAWDLESWVRRNATEVSACASIEVVDAGPLVATVRVTRRFGRSTLVQEYVLRAGSARLDIVFDIDWHEDEQVLSVGFPVAVHSATVGCGVQFGIVERPRYPNTSWDAAKFEVCAHRFVDVSEPSFGVAVLNDSRYGHAVLGDTVHVTLLRAPKWPAPDADRGRHRTTVSLFPHAGDRRAVVREAEALNTPLRAVPGRAARGGTGAPAMTAVGVGVDQPGVQVSAVKLADDGSGDVVVRLFEAVGDRAAVTLSLPYAVTSAERVNLLEDPGAPLEIAGSAARVALRPFELATIRLRQSTA